MFQAFSFTLKPPSWAGEESGNSSWWTGLTADCSARRRWGQRETSSSVVCAATSKQTWLPSEKTSCSYWPLFFILMKVSQVFIALQHCTWNVGVNGYAHSLWYLLCLIYSVPTYVSIYTCKMTRTLNTVRLTWNKITIWTGGCRKALDKSFKG